MKHLSTEHQRHSPADASGRELPVLFHLMDVSRPRNRPAVVDLDSAPPAPTLSSAGITESLTVPEIPTSDHVSKSGTPELSPPAEPMLPEAVLPQAASAEVKAAPAATSRFSLDRPIELVTTPVAAQADNPASDPPAATEFTTETSSLPETAHPVTPRPPLESRRKSRMPFSEDWFAAHGRYIAVVFVIALLGTIYLARTNRRPASSVIPTHVTTKNDIASPRSIDIPPLVANSPSSASASTTAPKLVDTASAAIEARTELHPPTTDPVAKSPETARSGDQNLFVFPQSKQSEQRVAARENVAPQASGPAMTTQPPAAAPFAGPALTPAAAPAQAAVAPPAVPTMSHGQAPSLDPSYPTAAMPPINYPATSPPQHAYPTTAAPPLTEAPTMPPRFAPGQPAPAQPVYPTTNSYQPPPASGAWQPTGPQAAAPAPAGAGAWTPASPGGWSPPVTSGGMPPQYQPPNNTASGFRNERTGSGLY